MKLLQITIALAALAIISGCGNSKPSSGDIKKSLERDFSGCKNIGISSAKKTNGAEISDKLYSVDYEFTIKKVAQKEIDNAIRITKELNLELEEFYKQKEEIKNKLSSARKERDEWIKSKITPPISYEEFKKNPPGDLVNNTDLMNLIKNNADYAIVDHYNYYMQIYGNEMVEKLRKESPMTAIINDLSKREQEYSNDWHIKQKFPAKSPSKLMYEGCGSEAFKVVQKIKNLDSNEWGFTGTRVMKKTENGWQ